MTVIIRLNKFHKLALRIQALIFHSNNDRSKNVKKNILESLFIKGFNLLISLLLVPLTLGYVSSELYGVWLTISSILTWLGLFDIGFTLGLKNKLTEALALGDYKKGKQLVSTTYYMMILIFVPLSVVLEIVNRFIDWSSFLNVNAIYNDDITKVMQVLLAFFCLQMIVNVIICVVEAYQNVALSGSFNVIGNFISLIVIYALTKLCPPSLFVLGFALSLIPVLVASAASFLLYKSKYKDVSPSISSINKSYIKELFSLGYKFFIIMLQVIIMYQTTNILISNISGPNDVTSYNIAYKYVTIMTMVFSIIMSPLWPAFTDAYTKNDYSWMRMVYRKMKFIYVLVFSLTIIMIVISPFVYHVWIGDKAVIPMSMTIAVGAYALAGNWMSLQTMLINGVGAIQLQLYVSVVGMILHIPLSLLLGKYIGPYGVLVSLIIITAISSIFLTIQLNKVLNKHATGIWIR
jgi:O-antigen/teichoic acid export membrane protein